MRTMPHATQPVDVVELDAEHVTVSVAPAFAPAVTLHVVKPPRARSWRVARDRAGVAVISTHSEQHAAVRSAITRARRYGAAYAINRQAVTR